MASLRAVVPRASLSLRSQQLRHRLILPLNRSATTAPPPPKPRVLEKPERFNPPSHGSRLKRPRQYPGPPLSQKERQAQQTRKYPHMMPAEGTWMFWFLTNRAVHLYITLSILVSLVLTIWFRDFVDNTPYLDLLPPNSMIYAHPFAFINRYFQVYKMHVVHVSQETAERRQQLVEDVKKRGEYRKVHNLNEKEGFLGWTLREDRPRPDPAMGEGGKATAQGSEVAVPEAAIPGSSNEQKPRNTYVDFDGNLATERKKWFGIW